MTMILKVKHWANIEIHQHTLVAFKFFTDFVAFGL